MPSPSASPRSPRDSPRSARDSPRSARESPRGGDSPRVGGRRLSARRRQSAHEDSPRWETGPRVRPAAHRSNSSLLADFVVKNDEIELLKESLQKGGGIVARKTAGEFLKGFRLAAGADLKLEAFDIVGLKEGDELDVRLADVVQDSLTGSKEDDRDIHLLARPPWYEPEEVPKARRCRRFWSCLLPCCVRPGGRRWRRQRRCGEGLYSWLVRVQQAFLRLIYRRTSASKRRDIFVSYQYSDKDLASWLRLFCDMRSLSVYAQLPRDAARMALREEKAKQEAQAAGKAGRKSRRMSLRSMEEPNEATGAEEQEAEAKEDLDTSLLLDVPSDSFTQWLKDREEMIRGSRVLIVIASQEALENASVLQDCTWAFQWGVPVLPVRRGQAKELRELRKKLGFIFALKLGVPEVGLGTNRKDFFFKVSAALAAGIRMGRKTKGKRLPRNMWDFFLRAVKQLNRDANEAAEQKAQVAAPCLTAGEARFRIDKGMLVGLPDMGQLEHNVPEEVNEAVETEGNPALPQAEEDLTGLSPEMEDRTFGVLSMLSLQGSQNPQVATKAAQALRAITAAEPGARAVASFGGVEVLLSLAQLASEGAVTANARAQDKKSRGKSGFGFRIPQGSSRNTSARAVEALGFGKSARRGDGTDLPPESARGDFSPKSARRRGKDESPPMSARGGTSPRSARGRRGAEDESPPMSARGGTSPRSARGRRGAEDESLPMSARGGTSPRSARGRRGMEDDSPPMSARGGNSPMSGRKGAEEAPESGRERPTLAGLAGQEFQEFRTSEAAPSTCGACCAACCKRRRGDELADDDDDEEQGGAGGGGGKRSSGDKDSVGLYLRLADHSFAALRNLAAHSQSRKQQILEQGGEQVAVEALGAFRLQKVAENACIASAALVRNLSEGADGVEALAEAGFLKIAEEELEDHRGALPVRRHILAALQNMAACVAVSEDIFPSPGSWLDLCSITVQLAVEDKDSRTTRQALRAMGNFAVLRAAKEAEDMEDAGTEVSSDHGHGPTAHLTSAPDAESSESGSEDEPVDELEDVSPELQRSKSQSSEISVPTDDQDMEFSLTKANGKVPEGMIQKMLELVQASRKAPQADDARRSGASLVAASAAATLANFAQDTDIERFIGSLGGLEIMLDSMEVATEDFHLQATRFLWNMTFSKANQQRFIDHGGIAKLVDSMKRFQQPHHGPLQEQGCGVIRNLACGHSGRHKRALLKSGTIRALCKALKLFHQEANVCVQAMAALTELCLGAPPAAHQARTLGALRWLLASLKLAGTNAQVTEQVLEALEAILLIPQALAAFGQHGGHLEVLKVLDRFSSDTTVLLAFRTLAAALSHTKLKEMVDGDSTEDLAYLITSSAERETQLEYWKQMGKSPGSLIRQDLLDAGLIQKVIDALQQFDQYTIAIEAGAGVLMNLTLEVQEVDQDEKHLQRKLDVGMACHGCLEIIGHLSGQRNTAGFASNMFRLLAAVSLHEEIALLLHRKQAAKTALEYLQAYEEEPVVQAAGCAFLGNLANAKLHIREGIVEVGVLDFLIALLVRKRSVALVVQSACKALKELSPAEAALGILKRFPIVDNVFQAADPHLAEADVMAASLALLWMLSAIDTNYAEELNKKQTTTRVLQVLRTHRAHHEVCRCCGGLLRNLFSAPLSAQASEECLAAEGLRLLLDALWTHCVPPVEGTMSRANYVLANRGSMDSVDEGPQRAGSTLAQGPQRAGSTLAQGPQRAGSTLAQGGPQRAGSTLAQGNGGVRRGSVAGAPAGRSSVRRTSVRRNSIRNSVGDSLPTKIFSMDEAHKVTTVEAQAVAEQILAALKNLAAYSKLATALAEEIFRCEEWEDLRTVVELYPKSIMVQYQGFELIGKLVNAKRELRAAFRLIADHVLLMNLHHKTTPVADVAELLLEALN